MKVSQNTTKRVNISSWIWLETSQTQSSSKSPSKPPSQYQQLLTKLRKIDPLQPVKQWLDNLEIKNSRLAHKICQVIPSQCPFERDIKLFGRTLMHIPPMCKLNPIYDQLVGLRFRALCYLSDQSEDISAYC
ncbi:MAG: nitrogenase [Coleofasciculaceae cyanobacterium SM2_1_6]|nr:nitrogenase [Coleofasciculaceae cyanobacterium SM2_1_6]